MHAKYECSSPYSLSQVHFKGFASFFLCKTGCARAEPKYDRRGIILPILVEDHQIMLYTKCICFSHYGLLEDFLKISCFVSM